MYKDGKETKRLKGAYMMIFQSKGLVVEGIFKNCMFEAYFDGDFNILHILDCMGDSEGYRSVTNTIDIGLIEFLEKELEIKSAYEIFLYGTDNYVFEYSKLFKGFRYIPREDVRTFSTFVKDMEYMYN